MKTILVISCDDPSILYGVSVEYGIKNTFSILFDIDRFQVFLCFVRRFLERYDKCCACIMFGKQVYCYVLYSTMRLSSVYHLGAQSNAIIHLIFKVLACNLWRKFKVSAASEHGDIWDMPSKIMDPIKSSPTTNLNSCG